MLSASRGASGRHAVVLLVLAVLFLVSRLRLVLKQRDPDAPPTKWLTMTRTMRSTLAFTFGVLARALAPKFWIFTLGAISAIHAADLGRPLGIPTYLLFVLLTQIVQLTILVAAFAAPDRSARVLDDLGGWLERSNRGILMTVSFAVGAWLLYKSLVGLGAV